VISCARHHADGPLVGDAVYAFVGQGQGAFAQYVTIPRDWLAPKPATLDFRHAAAVPLAALTAWQGLFEHGRLQSGARVLIHAAAGGVGHFAVQFAKAHGAEVYASASGDGVEWVRSLGADHVIDYRNADFTEAARDIDLVFDLVGGATQQQSWQVLKQGGALISTVAEPDPTQAAARGIRAARYTAHPDAAQLAQIGRLIDAGRVEVRVTQVFPFAEAAAAQHRLEAGHNRGKIVLDFGAPPPPFQP
jgi:NADPH:quinone reductase-like Zn-dependent oxidoreductase